MPFHGELVYSNNQQVLILNGATGEERVIWHGGEPQWAPDGRRIALTRARRLYITDALTGQPSHITIHDIRPAIGFIRWDSTGKYIYSGISMMGSRSAIDIQTGEMCRNIKLCPEWPQRVRRAITLYDSVESPDGMYIVGRLPRYMTITVQSAEGSFQRNLGRPTLASPFAWSKDSNKIAYFASDGNYKLVIYDMESDSSIEVPFDLGEMDMCCESPSWSPDGKSITFTAGKEIATGLESSTVDTWIYLYSTESKVFHKLFRGSSADWRPVGE